MSLPRVILKPKRARPFYGRHPWVFPGAIAAVAGDPADGAVVDLVSSTGNFVARGLWNSQSKIRVRLLTWSAEEEIDEAFFRRRLEKAIRLRAILGMDSAPGGAGLGLVPSPPGTPGGEGQGEGGQHPARSLYPQAPDAATARHDEPPHPGPLPLSTGGEGSSACRLVFSESDGLSGLVVDRFGRWLVVQFTSLGLAQRRDMIAGILRDLVQPEGIYLRTERGIGQLEGLDLQDGPLWGNLPSEPIVIDEHGVKFQVNLAEGQKTGFYLDQRDNRRRAAEFARGRRVLDAFCYTGGFALQAAKGGAASVLGVDVSEPALQLARTNAALNRLEETMTFERFDVFDRLDQLTAAEERFGVVILDPPKFARAGAAVEDALRGYRRLQTLAIQLLETDGILVVCCCTGLITRIMLQELLSQLSAEMKRPIQILESRGPSADHPVSATCPETDYLKCLICRVE